MKKIIPTLFALVFILGVSSAYAAAKRPNIIFILARDFGPSPFPGEGGVLYACGFNGSCFKSSPGTA